MKDVSGRTNSKRPCFLITIDVEGDDLWAKSRIVTTENSKHLHRFQELCEEFGFRPTYLVDYEMANSEDFRRFGREIIDRNTAEIAMHLHGWNTPPLIPLTDDDFFHAPYLVEYPEEVMREKVRTMTVLLEDVFSVKVISHRSGRWSLDQRYAKVLLDEGYKVDCSVTPYMSWAWHSGSPTGKGGPDYTRFPDREYWIDLDDISRPGTSSLLEVPVTVVPSFRLIGQKMASQIAEGFTKLAWQSRSRLFTRLATRAAHMLRPNGRNRKEMLTIIDYLVEQKRNYGLFMLHSSELMAGASPSFGTQKQIDALYGDIRLLFERVSRSFQGATLGEFHEAVSRERSGSND